MAQHDYVIANGTGAAVRSDINGALAAIVSQNSGPTEPSPTYAYQPWADTTAGLFKIRNAANNAWITLYQLDGEWSTLAIENGSASAPSIYFKDSGTDTGIYSPGTDQVAISTAGTGRLFVNASGNVGLGTSSPSGLFDARGLSYLSGAQIRDSSHVAKGYVQGDARGFLLATDGSTNIVFDVNGTERVRLDTSGRLGIGTTSPSVALHVNSGSFPTAARFDTTSALGSYVRFAKSGTDGQYLGYGADILTGASGDDFAIRSAGAIRFGTNGDNLRCTIDTSGRLLVGTSSGVTGTSVQIQGSSVSSAGGAVLYMQRGQGAGSISSGDTLGRIYFASNTGGVYAGIEAQTDGSGAESPADYPGRLVFSTTADGASSPTERMRITNDGFVLIGSTSTASRLYVETSSTGNTFGARATNASYVTTVGFFGADRNTSNNSFYYIDCYNYGSSSYRLRVADSGNVTNANNSYGSISDLKLKENIVDANSQWNDLKALQVRKYNFKEGQTHTQIGLIAQEVELVSPGLVSESPDRDEEGNDLGTVTKSVNYSVLYMKAVKALQEAMDRIEQLESEMAAVKAQLS
jgi:hypothetical protein